MMKLVSVCLLFFLVLFPLFAPKSFANTKYQIPQASLGQINEALEKTVPIRILPSNPLYFLILIKENISRFLQPSANQRARFDLVLSGKRLKEAHLLLDKKDNKNVNNNLQRYARKLNDFVNQLQKARSQNQDVTTLIAQTAEDLRIHQILFFAIKEKLPPDKINENFNNLIEAFTQTVMTIDQIKPGLKDRFQTVISQESPASPTPTPETEATPSTRPRRVIF